MKFIKLLLFLSFFLTFEPVFGSSADILEYIQHSYPSIIKHVSAEDITWKDGTHTHIRSSSFVLDKLTDFFHQPHPTIQDMSLKDLQCDNYEPFFRKMYGDSAAEVKKHLVMVYWMPHVFGKRYPLLITTVNGVNKKIEHISAELEKLPASYYKFLDNPGGSFYWRKVAHESYMSAHSFGIALDINTHYGSYWLWDLEKAKRHHTVFKYQNKIPLEIVKIFEKEGFLWGGRWMYYDTMHFEYRPELFTANLNNKIQYNNQLGLRC